MGMGIDDTIENGNRKEWESPCTGMGMAYIPMGINSHRQLQCLAYVTYSLFPILVIVCSVIYITLHTYRYTHIT